MDTTNTLQMIMCILKYILISWQGLANWSSMPLFQKMTMIDVLKEEKPQLSKLRGKQFLLHHYLTLWEAYLTSTIGSFIHLQVLIFSFSLSYWSISRFLILFYCAYMFLVLWRIKKAPVHWIYRKRMVDILKWLEDLHNQRKKMMLEFCRKIGRREYR